MRIIAGTLKGRRLTAPRGQRVRPTSDRLRETLFNVLTPDVGGASVLDAFAGTGAIGIEAASRGASRVTFLERDPAAVRALSANLDACGLREACAIIRDDFLTTRVRDARFDLVLIDPPYDVPSLEEVVSRGDAWLADGGRLVLEHSSRRISPETAGSLRRYRVLKAGDSALSFYERSRPLE